MQPIFLDFHVELLFGALWELHAPDFFASFCVQVHNLVGIIVQSSSIEAQSKVWAVTIWEVLVRLANEKNTLLGLVVAIPSVRHAAGFVFGMNMGLRFDSDGLTVVIFAYFVSGLI